MCGVIRITATYCGKNSKYKSSNTQLLLLLPQQQQQKQLELLQICQDKFYSTLRARWKRGETRAKESEREVDGLVPPLHHLQHMQECEQEKKHH